MHKSCIGLTTAEFSALGKSDESWSCQNCLKPNNSSIVYTVPVADTDPAAKASSLDGISDISQSTRYSSTSTEHDISSTAESFSVGFDVRTSSPKVSRENKKNNNKILRMLNINFQSLRKKGKLLEAIIDDSDPDIIIGTEKWLDSTICSAEIIPFELGYDIQLRDRPNDPHGGVLIAAKNTFNLEMLEPAKTLN